MERFALESDLSNEKLPREHIGPLVYPPPGCQILVYGTQETTPLRKPASALPWLNMLNSHLPAYTLIRHETQVALTIAVFISTPLLRLVKSHHCGKIATGLAGIVANKGAVGIALQMTDGRSFLFLNSHLAAHQDKVIERNNDIARINREIKMFGFEKSSARQPHVVDRYDYVFWFGDLNYRVYGSNFMVKKLLDEGRFEILLSNDQLHCEMRMGRSLSQFSEGEISFLPTFKFDPGTKEYDTSLKKRIPSWTDRILFKCRVSCAQDMPSSKANIIQFKDNGCFNSKQSNDSHRNEGISVENYRSINELVESDHRPVVGTFVVHAAII